jgi:hypothetical protein
MILYGIVFFITFFIGLFIVPILYFFRDTSTRTLFWYFYNDTKQKNKYDVDAGDFGRFKHNIIGFYRQNALRNPQWNLKLTLAPKKGKKENVKGNLEWRRYNLKGWQFATYEIKGSKYFRMSYSAGWFYFQLGASDNRYIYKFKNRLWSIIYNKIFRK